MSCTATYVAITGPSRFELRETPLPPLPSDAALLRIESCGVCGTDVELFRGHDTSIEPIVPGHESVGRIEQIGSEAAHRWGLTEGSRIALNARLGCGRCAQCRAGEYCKTFRGPLGISGYGYLGASFAPSLWGGFATHLYLDPVAEFVRVPEQVPVGTAALFNALSNGIAWAIDAGGVRLGDRVAILGPGPRGLACATAAHIAGASEIVVTGLASDASRLEFASRLAGARGVQVHDEDEPAELIRELGQFDVVIDTTPGSRHAGRLAVALARTKGTVVFGGLKHGGMVELDVDSTIQRQLTLRGALSSSNAATAIAVELLARSDLPFVEWASHSFGLQQFDQAIAAATGDAVDTAAAAARALHVRVEPTDVL